MVNQIVHYFYLPDTATPYQTWRKKRVLVLTKNSDKIKKKYWWDIYAKFGAFKKRFLCDPRIHNICDNKVLSHIPQATKILEYIDIYAI